MPTKPFSGLTFRLPCAPALRVAGTALAQAPEPPSTEGQPGAYKAILIGPQETHREEPGLPPSSSLLRPFASKRIPEKSKEPGHRIGGMTDTAMERPEAFRVYLIDLKPKEKLCVNLKSEAAAEMAMRFIRRTRMDPLAPQVRIANMSPQPTRRTTIKIENPKDETLQAELFIGGKAGHPYRIDLVRTLPE